MEDRSWLEIDLGRLDHNVRAIRSAIGDGVKLCAVIKQDGYGLGALPLAQRLAARGVDMLGLYDAPAAAELLKAGVSVPMLMLGPIRQIDRTGVLYRALDAGRLMLSVHSMEQLKALDEVGRRLGVRVKVHVYIDTGMSRSGVPVDEAGRVLKAAAELPHVQTAGVYTHFAAAQHDGPFTRDQNDRFLDVIETHEACVFDDTILHAANTFATFRGPDFHHHMVRVGLGLFGFGHEMMSDWGNPDDGIATLEAAPEVALKPIARWLSRLNHIERFPRGATVGYDRTHRLKRDSVLGIVPVGYGDGYPLSLSGKGQVTLTFDNGAWHSAPVLGKVNMDQLIVDLTDVTTKHDLGVGQAVELISWNPDMPSAMPNLAELGDTSCYELLCRLSPRIARRFVDGGL